jgi:sugar phosphate permease
MVAAVVSYVVGGPLSGWLMDHPHLGLRGWQWLFLVEGVPSFVLGVAVFFYLPNGPQTARWLSNDEAAWLTARLGAERTEQERHGRLTLGQALGSPRVLLLSLVYFLGVTGAYGLDFFSPTLLSQAYPGASTSALGWIAAIPPLVTIPIMVLWGRSSDSRRENRWHVALPLFALAAGLLALGLHLPPALTVAALSLCVAGRWCFIGPFWGLPTSMLTGTAAAGGIALINSIGNLGGQAGPVLVSLRSSSAGSLEAGLAMLALVVAISGAIVLVLPVRREHVEVMR